MTPVFTEARPTLDRGLLAANLALGALALAVVGLALAGVRPTGVLDVPIAVTLFAWLSMTPLLAGAGVWRARTQRWRRAFATHALLGSVWALTMVAGLTLPFLRA